jgi:hypothetical protein
MSSQLVEEYFLNKTTVGHELLSKRRIVENESVKLLVLVQLKKLLEQGIIFVELNIELADVENQIKLSVKTHLLLYVVFLLFPGVLDKFIIIILSQHVVYFQVLLPSFCLIDFLQFLKVKIVNYISKHSALKLND